MDYYIETLWNRLVRLEALQHTHADILTDEGLQLMRRCIAATLADLAAAEVLK